MYNNRLTKGIGVVGGIALDGIAGATATSRFVGATASGSPASGTFAIGDVVVDRTGNVYVCTVAGSPGTWVATGSLTGNASLANLTATGKVTLTPPAALTYTSGGTTTCDPTTGTVFTVTTATGNSNLALSASPAAGQLLIFVVNNDAGGARTITFTTHFKASGTLVGTASKACVIGFVSNGTDAIEMFRAGAAGGTSGM
jgi:hypothetical protein